jgi:acetylornithine deacetylase/succinyl-diaminopimelate desuccinylase family protein
VADELTKLLADLVATPSINPMGRDRRGKEYLEESVAQQVLHYLKRHRIDVEIQHVFPGRPNILGFVDVGARETMLLEAHLDTVPVDNMSIDPFDPVVKKGKLFGRGSCDTKASLAAILFSVKSLLPSRNRLSRNIIIAAVCDEEYGLNGTKAIVKSGRKLNYAIVGEPTGLEIINCHKGVVRWRMSVHGKSAHSAYPQQGANAIFHMARLLEALEQHSRDLLGGRRHRMLGSATLSVGMIEGGQSVNTVPNLCTVEIDRRTLPGETASAIAKTIKRLVPRSIRYSMAVPHLVVPGLDSQQNRTLVQLLREAFRKCRAKPRIHGARYVTDASLYAARGIPSVVFGPGRIEQAHSEREFVRLSEVRTAVDIYRALLTTN